MSVSQRTPTEIDQIQFRTALSQGQAARYLPLLHDAAVVLTLLLQVLLWCNHVFTTGSCFNSVFMLAVQQLGHCWNCFRIHDANPFLTSYGRLSAPSDLSLSLSLSPPREQEATPPTSSGCRQSTRSCSSHLIELYSGGETSSASPNDSGSEDPESNASSPGTGAHPHRPRKRDTLAYALHTITIFAYCGMAVSLNSVDASGGPLKVEVNVLWLLSSLTTILASALCKTVLWRLHYRDTDWVVKRLLLPEFYMALFCLVALFGHANLVGQQHFDAKTFVAAFPILVYALSIHMLLDGYGRAPSLKALFSLIYSN